MLCWTLTMCSIGLLRLVVFKVEYQPTCDLPGLHCLSCGPDHGTYVMPSQGCVIIRVVFEIHRTARSVSLSAHNCGSPSRHGDAVMADGG